MADSAVDVAEGSVSGSAGAKRPQRRVWRWLVGGLGGVVVLLIVLVALLPAIASSGWVRGLVLGQVNGTIPGQVHVDSWSVGWFSEAVVEGVSLVDADGVMVFEMERVDAGEVTVWGLLRDWERFGKVAVVRPRLEVVRGADGVTNVERALGLVGGSSGGGGSGTGAGAGSTGGGGVPMVGVPFGVRGEVEVVEGEVRVVDEGLGVEHVVGFEAGFALETLDDVHLWLASPVGYGEVEDETASGLFASLQGSQWVAPDGRLTLGTGQLTGQAKLKRFPSEVVDAILGRRDVSELLGEVITLGFGGHWRDEAGQVMAFVESERVQADLDLAYAGGVVAIEAGEVLRWVVAPETLARLQEGVAEPLVVGQSVEVVVVSDGGEVGVDQSGRVGLQLRVAGLDGAGSVVPVVLRHASLRAPLAVGGLTADLGLTGTSLEDALLRVDLAEASIRYGEEVVPLGAARAGVRLSGRSVVLEDVGLGFTTGGEIGLAGHVGLDDPMAGSLVVTAEGVDLQPLALAAVGRESFVSRTAGVMDAEVRLEGPLARVMTEAGGWGTVTVRDGNLAPLPVLSEVLGVALDSPLDLEELLGSDELVDTADVAFTLVGDRVRLDEVRIETEQASVEARGEVTFLQELDALVSVRLTKADEAISGAIDDEIDRAARRVGGDLGALLGVLGREVRRDVQERVAEELADFRVTGTVEAPVVRRR
ncbi:hypothetical protein [Mucisphaera sp.]|uniref:hypothetical protein n=1 Tax=Mucisphaera sp. TaxID=2913024 RepID=UPI003D14DC09